MNARYADEASRWTYNIIIVIITMYLNREQSLIYSSYASLSISIKQFNYKKNPNFDLILRIHTTNIIISCFCAMVVLIVRAVTDIIAVSCTLYYYVHFIFVQREIKFKKKKQA